MSTVRINHDGRVTVVTIDRPEVRNAVDRATADALADAFRAFEDDEDRDVAILTGDFLGCPEDKPSTSKPASTSTSAAKPASSATPASTGGW